MKQALILHLLICVCSNLAGQCEVATNFLDVEGSSIVNLDFDGQHLLQQDRNVCLAGAQLEQDLPCLAAGQLGISVWYKITTDEASGLLYSGVTSNTAHKPVWQFYFEVEEGAIVPVGVCSNESLLSNILTYEFSWDNNYFVHIQIPFEEPPTEQDSLSITFFQSPYADRSPCANVTTDGQALDLSTVTIVDRENNNLPEHLIAPGESVTVEIRVDINMQEGLAGNIHGLLPMLGDGWDHNYFYSVDQYAYVHSSVGDWITNRDDCNGEFNVGSDIFCIYFDEEDHVKICNKLVEHCPCEGTISAGDRQPAGWYFTKKGVLSGCANNCKTSERIASIAPTAKAFLRLKLRASTDVQKRDLSIKILPTSDYFTGCHPSTNNYCEYQIPFVFNPYTLVDQQADYFALDYPWTVCNRDSFPISLAANGITDNTVTINYISNLNLNGIPNDAIELGADDQILRIENETNEIQVLEFMATGTTLSGTLLEQGPYKIEVLPDHELLENTFEVCIGGCATITLKTNWENRRNLNFDWSTGDTGAELRICDDTDYVVTVSDSKGCDIITEEIEKEAKTNFAYEVEGDESFCDFSPSSSYQLTIDQDLPPLWTQWQLRSAGTILLDRTNVYQFTIPQTFISILDTATIQVDLATADGCEVTINKKIEIFHPEENLQRLALCYLEDVDQLYKNVKIDLNRASKIEEIRETPPNSKIDFIWDENDSLLLIFSHNVSLAETYRIQLLYENGCDELLHFDILSYVPGSAEIIHSITDFEVDFELSFPQVVDSILWSFGDSTFSKELFPSKIYNDIDSYDVQATIYTNCGTTETFFSTVTIAGTATKENELEGFSIFPNPASDAITVEGLPTSSPSLITIYNLMGTAVASSDEQQTASQIVDLSGIPSGTYLLSVVSNKTRYQKKFLIIRD